MSTELEKLQEQIDRDEKLLAHPTAVAMIAKQTPVAAGPLVVPEWTAPTHREVDPLDADYDEIVGSTAVVPQPTAMITEIRQQPEADAGEIQKSKSPRKPKKSAVSESEQVSQLKQQLAEAKERAETAEAREDELQKAAVEAVRKQEAAELERKRHEMVAIAQRYGHRIPANIPNAEVLTYHAHFAELEKRAREWKTPRAIQELSRVEKFRLEFLPQSLRPWVVNVSERMGMQYDFAAVSAIVVLAGMTGRRVFVFPKKHDKGWKESICLSGAIVGLSGGLKTPTFKAFINPALENDAIWREEHAKQMAEYLKQLRLFKLNKIAEEPEKPKACRCAMMTDATPEAMHENMQNNPEGILYFRDELSGWLDELSKDGRESQRAMFLEAMSGNNPYPLDRIGRGKVYATMCASVLGSFQPNRLEIFLNMANNIADGLVPRFGLLVYPDRTALTPVDKPEDVMAKQAYRAIARTLVQARAEQITMHFTGDAQEEFDKWFQQMIGRINREHSDIIRSHLSKYLGVLPKLAGLFQLVDNIAVHGAQLRHEPDVSFEPGAESKPAPDGFSNVHPIDRDHLLQAINLMVYLESHAQRIYASIKSPLQAAIVTLARQIKTGNLGSQFGARDIGRKHWKGLADYGLIEQAIQSLEEMHWIRKMLPEPVKPGHRPPAERWEVNPMVKDASEVAQP